VGLIMKYFVLFVLKPKGSNAYARASRAAMLTYAKEIRRENPELAEELLAWSQGYTCLDSESRREKS